MVAGGTPDFNKWFNQGLSLLHGSKFHSCLFADNCKEEVIWGHSVSRSILTTMQHKGHVIRPGVKFRKDASDNSQLQLAFLSAGINRASTGTFTCRSHDEAFTTIDTIPLDFDNPTILNLLFYRAVLRETWQLLRTQRAVKWLESRGRIPGPLSVHPDNRLRALLEAIRYLRPLLHPKSSNGNPSPVAHIVARVKTRHPVVAASCAGGGSHLAIDSLNNRELSADEIRTRARIEPNASWGLTIIPHANEHVVIASWLRGSTSEQYFRHLRAVSGKELQAAVSAELIYFCENWYLHPIVSGSYGESKRRAILCAYNNLAELQFGKYKWLDRGQMKWFDYLDLSNRHQINLFSYKESPLSP